MEGRLDSMVIYFYNFFLMLYCCVFFRMRLILLVVAVFGVPPTKEPGELILAIANRLSKQQVARNIPYFVTEPQIDSSRSMSVDRARGSVPTLSNELSFDRISDAIRYLFTSNPANVNRANRELIPMIRGLLKPETPATNESIAVRIVQLKRQYQSQIDPGYCRNVMSAIRRLFDENPSFIDLKNRDLFPHVRALVPHCTVSDDTLNSKISRIRSERKGPITERSASEIAKRIVLSDPTLSNADIDREVRSVMKKRSLKPPSDHTDIASNALTKLRKETGGEFRFE
jgi:hypothetical protein